MPLHQFLRIMNNNTPVVLFDISGSVIIKVSSKQDIPIDLYEYDVFQVSCGTFGGDTSKQAVHIMLEK